MRQQELKRKKQRGSVLSTSIELKELDAAHIKQISEGLEQFEEVKGYINHTVTLKLMAQEMQTNSAYLSKYINAIKGVNYSHYINTLRIEYVIQNLTTHTKWHSYTIEAIGGEAGFSTARSFTTHFKLVTGISVSYFLKQIEKEGPNILLHPTLQEDSAKTDNVIPIIDRSA